MGFPWPSYTALTRSMHSYQRYRKTKRGHLSRFLANLKARARRKGLPVDVDLDYLESIATDECPVFKEPFVWGQAGDNMHTPNPNGPSLDRVIPELGYVRGNLVFISHRANSIKQNVTELELYMVADWLHDKRKEVLNAFPGQSAPVPTPGARAGKEKPEPGSADGARAWKDCDGAQHHQAELFGTHPGGCA